MDRNTLLISHLAVLITGFWIAGALPQAQGPTETITGTREASAPWSTSCSPTDFSQVALPF